MRKRKSSFMRALEARQAANRQQAAPEQSGQREDAETPSHSPWLPKRKRPYWK